MSISLRERVFGEEDEDDFDENSVTDSLNVTDDLLLIFARLITTLIIGLGVTVAIGKFANVNGVTAFNDILKVAITVFIVGIILTLALLIFVYNMVVLVLQSLPFTRELNIPQFDLQETTVLLIDLLYQFVIT